MAAPGYPTGTKATYNPESNSVVVAWTPAAGTASVKIQRWVSTTKLYSDLTTVTGATYFVDTGIQAGLEYAYRFLPVNAAGESPRFYSAPTETVKIITAPQPVTEVEAEFIPGGGVGTVRVKHKNNDTTLAPYSYHYYFRSDNSAAFRQVNRRDGALETFVDAHIERDRRYVYRVWTSNEVGGARYHSAPSGVVYTQPAALTHMSARWDGPHMRITWRLPSQIASKVELEHTTDGEEWFPLATLGRATAWTHTSLERGIRHKYRGRTVTPDPDLGEAQKSEWTESPWVEQQSTPDAPLILGPAYTPGGASFDVDVLHQPIDGGPLGGVKVRHRRAGTSTWTEVTGVTVPAYTAPGAVEVQAATRTGSSAYGDWSDTARIELRSRPTPTFTSPAQGGTITGPLAPAAWNVAAQVAWEIKVYRGSLVAEHSGTTERQVAIPVEDSGSYRLDLRVFDGYLWSNTVSRNVATAFDSPEAATIDVVADEDHLQMQISTRAASGVARVEILRQTVGGEWVSIGSVPPGQVLIDHTPPLGVDYLLAAINWSTSGASTSMPPITVRIDRAVVAVNWGGDLAGLATLEVDIEPPSESVSLDSELHHFAGRSLPVQMQGDAVTRTVSLAGRSVDELGSPAAVWRQMVAAPGPKWVRDPSGRSFAAAISQVSISETEHHVEVSFTATEIAP